MPYQGVLDPRPLAGGPTTPASIDASTTIASVCSGAALPASSGILTATLTIEGTAGCRYTIDGTTPTGSVGTLVKAAAANSPVVINLVGRSVISAFKIIGVSAGNTMTVALADQV